MTWRDGAAGAAAIAVGVLGAVSYYSQTLRPLAHSYIIWLLLVVVIAARRPPLQAALRGGMGLLVSVVAFCYGKQVVYDIIYGTDGYPYRAGIDELLLWGTLGLVGGAGLGVIAAQIGRTGWLPAAGSVGIVALLAVEAYQRYTDYAEILPALVALAGAATVFAVGDRSGRQLLRTAYMLIPATIAVTVVLHAPDWIQTYLRL